MRLLKILGLLAAFGTMVVGSEAMKVESPEEMLSQLMTASENGDLATVKDLILNKHVPVNGRGVNPTRPTNWHPRLSRPRWETALYNAARAGHLEIVRFLLTKGADVNASVSNGDRTWDHPLRAAVREVHVDIVKELVNVPGLELNMGDGPSGGQTALELAIYTQKEVRAGGPVFSKYERIITLLKQAEGKAVDAPEAEKLPEEQAENLIAGANSFYEKCEEGNLGVVKTWISNPPQPFDAEQLLNGRNATDSDRHHPTALMLAAGAGKFAIVNYLIEQGANLNIRDGKGRTVLRWAVNGKHSDIVKILIETGKCDQESIHDAVITALYNGYDDIAQYLYDHGALPAQSLALMSKRLQVAFGKEKAIVKQEMAIAASCLIAKNEAPQQQGDEEQGCPVCFNPFSQGDEVNVLKCGHYFHNKGDCWNVNKGKAPCPMCRSTAGSAFTFNMIKEEGALADARKALMSKPESSSDYKAAPRREKKPTGEWACQFCNMMNAPNVSHCKKCGKWRQAEPEGKRPALPEKRSSVSAPVVLQQPRVPSDDLIVQQLKNAVLVDIKKMQWPWGLAMIGAKDNTEKLRRLRLKDVDGMSALDHAAQVGNVPFFEMVMPYLEQQDKDAALAKTPGGSLYNYLVESGARHINQKRLINLARDPKFNLRQGEYLGVVGVLTNALGASKPEVLEVSKKKWLPFLRMKVDGMSALDHAAQVGNVSFFEMVMPYLEQQDKDVALAKTPGHGVLYEYLIKNGARGIPLGDESIRSKLRSVAKSGTAQGLEALLPDKLGMVEIQRRLHLEDENRTTALESAGANVNLEFIKYVWPYLMEQEDKYYFLINAVKRDFSQDPEKEARRQQTIDYLVKKQGLSLDDAVRYYENTPEDEKSDADDKAIARLKAAKARLQEHKQPEVKAPEPVVPQGAWACPACTFENEAGNRVCAMCGGPKVLLEGWPCPKCTFINANEKSTCEMCDTPKPKK